MLDKKTVGVVAAAGAAGGLVLKQALEAQATEEDEEGEEITSASIVITSKPSTLQPTQTGTIRGFLTDEAGNRVSEAPISLITGEGTYSTTTSSTGEFSFYVSYESVGEKTLEVSYEGSEYEVPSNSLKITVEKSQLPPGSIVIDFKPSTLSVGQTGTVQGYLTDDVGNRLTNVQVALSTEGTTTTTTTDSDGEFAFDIVYESSGSKTVEITYEGSDYDIPSQTFTITVETETYEITLDPYNHSFTTPNGVDTNVTVFETLDPYCPEYIPYDDDVGGPLIYWEDESGDLVQVQQGETWKANTRYDLSVLEEFTFTLPKG